MTFTARVSMIALTALPWVAGLLVCRDAQAGCTKDDECKGARICEKGRCVDPPAARAAEVAACRVDSDCGGEDVCADRRCVGPRPAAVAPLPPPPAPPAPPPVPLVPVTVVSPAGAVTVTVSPSVGGQVAPCTAPCTLQVPLGSAYVDARLGEKGYGTNVTFSGPSSMKVQLRGSMGASIAITVLGGVAFFVGLGVFGANGFATSCTEGDPSCNATVGVAGLTVMTIGAIMAISGGISFALIGSNHIDVVPGGATAFAGTLRVGALPTPGGAKGGVALSF
jgi:hypothetical protein